MLNNIRKEFDSKEDLRNYIDQLKEYSAQCNAKQHAIKLMINSIYGAFANEYFHWYNISIAESITLQGQDAIKYSEKMVNKYFKEFWHKDVQLHQKLGLSLVKPIKNDASIYIDTDTIFKDAIIKTNIGEFTMEDLYNKELSKNGSSDKTLAGHESTKTNLKVLNFVDNQIKYVPVKRLIRHKLNKQKWKLKTKSGKEIIITGDHSIIVFRDGKKIPIKAKDIKKRDKVLIIK